MLGVYVVFVFVAVLPIENNCVSNIISWNSITKTHTNLFLRFFLSAPVGGYIISVEPTATHITKICLHVLSNCFLFVFAAIHLFLLCFL